MKTVKDILYAALSADCKEGLLNLGKDGKSLCSCPCDSDDLMDDCGELDNSKCVPYIVDLDGQRIIGDNYAESRRIG